jgi:hypothetical protein
MHDFPNAAFESNPMLTSAFWSVNRMPVALLRVLLPSWFEFSVKKKNSL